MSYKALVFLSCGQREGERQLAAQIQNAIENELGFRCYNADTRQGFDDVMSITDHLSKADYYLFIDFKRKVNNNENDIPISIFTHQEFALARALGITEILAFREEGLPDRGPGMLGYVLCHSIEFKRENLVDLVKNKIKEKIGKGEWTKDYSRNLVISEIHDPKEAVHYTDHHGTNLELIWHVKVENRRRDRAALNTIAILDQIEDITKENPDRKKKPNRPDTTFLKWANQQAYQKTIFPEDSAELDVFSLRLNENGIYLHSSSDIYPKKPIISSPGNYILNYFLYADSFPPVRFKIKIRYLGPILAVTEFNGPGVTATLDI